MNLLLSVLAAASAATLVLALVGQRRLARRIARAAARLSDDVAPSGSGLAEATSVLERAVDRSLARGGEPTEDEERMALALAALPQGVVVFGPDQAIAFRNPVAADYLEARHGDALVEEAISELAFGAGGRSEGAALSRSVDLFGPPRRTLVLRAAQLHEGGRPLGVMVVIDDVTDRRRLEAVRRDFVANISHELKTPVGALALLAETLLAEDDPTVARRLAERILSEAFRVGRTIDDLLELSRIEADEEGRREDVPVERFISEAVDRVRPAAEQHEIVIDVEDPGPRLSVAGDRRQLVSAAYNLLENAVKYSDPGSSIQVRARTDGRWVDITVEDHGMGIPGRDLERVFERFYRVDRARSRETGGTGLGLAIVRHIANNHAGHVSVESTEGEGSQFTLRLPVGAGPVAVTTEAG